MIINAPINNYESCKAQINAGADELYVGLMTNLFTKLHFSARSQINGTGQQIMPSKEELKRIVMYAHAHNVQVNFTANIAYVSDYSLDGLNLENEYIHYVLEGINCGVDSVIVSDFGLMHTLNEMKLPVEIHSSTIFDTNSTAQLKFLKSVGVSRAVLSYQISMEDIKKMSLLPGMELEIFGYGGCSFSTYCNLGHGLSMGFPCKNYYYINNLEVATNCLDSTQGCCLCSLWKLNSIGVNVIKIVGRELPYNQVSPITKLFKDVIEVVNNTNEQEFNLKIDSIIPAWWRRGVCKQNQCKYQSEIQKYYI